MPLQHCNGDILRRMNRSGDRQSLTQLVEHIRQKIPGVILRTTLIGESDEQFEELCEFVKQVRFERLGCFAFSPEEGTPAFDMPEQVHLKTRERRAEIIMEEQMLISDEFNEKCSGKTLEVVCEGFDRYAECYYGRSAYDAPEIDGKVFFMSEYVNVLVDDTLDYDLIGSRV